MPDRLFSALEPRRVIAVLIDPGDSWGRQVIAGISSAVRQQLPWDLLIAPRDDQWRFRVPRNWRGAGIIAAIRDQKTAEHIRNLNLPTVNVSSWEKSREGWYRVITNDRQRAEMAFAHFHERRFQNYAYYGPPSQRYSDLRGESFRQVVTEAGFSCEIFQIPYSKRGWNSVMKQTLDWLKGAPRPLAVFAADPHPAIQLTEICHSVGIRIPEEIAILAGDTDDLLCAISDPPLSSIVLAAEQIGSASVKMLHALLAADPLSAESVLIPPLGVTGRQSTDILAVDDPLFVSALKLIRRHAHSGIQVGDILQMVPMSRRSLEQRFHQYLDRSPASEIRRIKLEQVKELLRSSEQTLEQLAKSVGFSSPSQLCTVFKKATGQTPKEYRQGSRQRGETP